jgi:hypothetical protein
MKRIYFLFLIFSLLACSKKESVQEQTDDRATVKIDSSSIFICGDNLIRELKYSAQAGNPRLVWQWRVEETIDLPAAYHRQFQSVDECKPSKDGKQLLITSSSLGAVLLLEKETKKALYYAKAPNAHSADFLPGNYIAVATSTATGGNSITLHHPHYPEKILFRDVLYSGHGVVWVAGSQKLYALAYSEIKQYSFSYDNPASPVLTLEKSWTLPEDDGHDLFKVSDNKFLVTTKANVWQFDVVTGTFKTFEPLKNMAKVKSVNYNESTRWLVYTKGETEWWTNNIYSQYPNKVINIPGVKWYKARFAN